MLAATARSRGVDARPRLDAGANRQDGGAASAAATRTKSRVLARLQIRDAGAPRQDGDRRTADLVGSTHLSHRHGGRHLC
jgi:hypothetical protein